MSELNKYQETHNKGEIDSRPEKTGDVTLPGVRVVSVLEEAPNSAYSIASRPILRPASLGISHREYQKLTSPSEAGNASGPDGSTDPRWSLGEMRLP